MYYLVGYFTHPSGARLRALHRSFGEEFPLSVLPVVSRAFESFGNAISSKEELQNARILAPHEGVLVQPDEEQIPALLEETAVHLLNRHEAWNEFVRGVAVKEHEIVVKTKEHSRCWVLIATVAQAQIPPGEAFVIDKHSQQVFARRYIDALPLFTNGQ